MASYAGPGLESHTSGRQRPNIKRVRAACFDECENFPKSVSVLTSYDLRCKKSRILKILEV
eukprot:1919047-Amphidinium_carterae.1